VTQRQVFSVIDAAFSQRRKMLRSALAALYGSTAQAQEVLEAAGVDPSVRGEQLALDDFISIARASSALSA
jgi:16S rRNA (adenine1518-N6/adenine1519-N6)-dimethyltransferase